VESLDDFIKKIKGGVPRVYFCQDSITHLEAFIEGYYYAKREFYIPTTEKHVDLKLFLEWIRTKYTVGKDRSWSRVILFYSEDERDALNNFLELYEQFQNQKERREDDKSSN
jgi:hypothetical protein